MNSKSNSNSKSITESNTDHFYHINKNEIDDLEYENNNQKTEGNDKSKFSNSIMVKMVKFEKNAVNKTSTKTESTKTELKINIETEIDNKQPKKVEKYSKTKETKYEESTVIPSTDSTNPKNTNLNILKNIPSTEKEPEVTVSNGKNIERMTTLELDGILNVNKNLINSINNINKNVSKNSNLYKHEHKDKDKG
eukprot:CAMPEP_0116928740 /NCGR_PEP_ID=MMETSP0467-20121206/26152_1 /TAXON_ID=283647 /ORGANISM="Mesodinium pulex, Strain SPMC105" /LENGTH=193 /DNA_ID=CAMNT_0004608549 /DNA_START=1688 /DNA_END=2269 /DNA_ORIENTATION=-